MTLWKNTGAIPFSPQRPRSYRLSRGKRSSLERKAIISDRFRDFFGLERNVLVMTLAGTLQGIGVGLWRGYLPKVLEEMGARPMAIGAFGTFSGLVGLIFPYLGGRLSDRLNQNAWWSMVVLPVESFRR